MEFTTQQRHVPRNLATLTFLFASQYRYSIHPIERWKFPMLFTLNSSIVELLAETFGRWQSLTNFHLRYIRCIDFINALFPSLKAEPFHFLTFLGLSVWILDEFRHEFWKNWSFRIIGFMWMYVNVRILLVVENCMWTESLFPHLIYLPWGDNLLLFRTSTRWNWDPSNPS